jgi:hypothetical protein
MTNPSLTIAVAAVAGITGVPVAAPGLAKSTKQVCYTAPLPVVVVAPQPYPNSSRLAQWLLGYDNVELLGRRQSGADS